MADNKPPKRKPRILKSAPTVRELAEASQAEPKKPKSRRFSLMRGFGIVFRPLGPIWRPLKRVLLWLTPRYFISSWKEVKQVTWPSRRETLRLTLAVFIFAAAFGVVVYFVDIGLDKLFKKVVLK
jgi:preprotein translocase SecE subunit